MRRIVGAYLGALAAALGLGVMLHVLLVLTDPYAPLSKLPDPPTVDTRWQVPSPPPSAGSREEHR